MVTKTKSNKPSKKKICIFKTKYAEFAKEADTLKDWIKEIQKRILKLDKKGYKLSLEAEDLFYNDAHGRCIPAFSKLNSIANRLDNYGYGKGGDAYYMLSDALECL